MFLAFRFSGNLRTQRGGSLCPSDVVMLATDMGISFSAANNLPLDRKVILLGLPGRSHRGSTDFPTSPPHGNDHMSLLRPEPRTREVS